MLEQETPVITKKTKFSFGELANERPTIIGKFLFVGEEKFWVKGVSYGTFELDEQGNEKLDPEIVEKDFSEIAKNGFNVVRTYTVPPRWLLDLAHRYGLRVMVGLSWTQHVAFLDKHGNGKVIRESVRKSVRYCAGHPSIFCYTIGNEIPSPIVRWYNRALGKNRVEKFLESLYQIVKQEDPTALVTYVNYPSTSYLRLDFLDFCCYNVYLESKKSLKDYIARLHNIAGERPLLLAEIGLDSRRNGLVKQAETLDWQIRTAFMSGCCGAVIFSWTDEWVRGGYPIENWDFGLTARDRSPKPALGTIRKTFAEMPFPSWIKWPKISVIVCSCNGGSTIRETLEGLLCLDYPNFEVIVVDDGSTDNTQQIASEYPFKFIRHEHNHGLSIARNTGLENATGEIVVYIDDDAYPDVHWLRFLALRFMDGDFAGVGGPSPSPPNDHWLSDVIANAPGPTHVLLSDKVAEHIPGVNMAFRKDALEAVGGFDVQFKVAGDDVDLCWKIQDAGGVIAFAPAAVVWHHRRKSISKYWKQQVGYGKGEALLEKKWPEKYNTIGQIRWCGRIYGKGLSLHFRSLSGRIYQGVWGSAPFQSMYRSSNSLWSLTLMPEWYLIIGTIGLLCLISFEWGSSISSFLLFSLLLSIAVPVAEAFHSAQHAKFATVTKNRRHHISLVLLTSLLHILQPLARLKGRLSNGLTPWRRHGTKTRYLYFSRNFKLWREKWEDPLYTLKMLKERLQKDGAIVRSGGDYDSWDLEVPGGLFGGSRLLRAVEDHGSGRQLFRFRVWPKYSKVYLALNLAFIFSVIGSIMSSFWITCLIMGSLLVLTNITAINDIGFASGMLQKHLKQLGAC